jgi:hypothetical protein
MSSVVNGDSSLSNEPFRNAMVSDGAVFADYLSGSWKWNCMSRSDLESSAVVLGKSFGTFAVTFFEDWV